MRVAVINFSDIAKDPKLRMSPSYIFSQIDAGLIKDQSKTLRYKIKCLLNYYKRKLRRLIK